MNKPVFSETDLRNMRRMASSLAECEQEIARGQCAGLPCDEQLKRCQHLREAYRKLLEAYDKPIGER